KGGWDYLCGPMLSIHLFRDDKDRILQGLTKKHFGDPGLVDQIIDTDARRRKLQVENDAVAAFVNSSSKEIGKLMSGGKREEAEALKREVAARKEEAQRLSGELSAIEAELNELLVQLPNLPHSSVPEGRTPDDNEVVREGGAKPDLSGGGKLPHWE